MQKWEYLTMAHIWDEDRKLFYWQGNKEDVDKIDDKLNRAGQEGWELVAIRVTGISSVLYLKRPIE